MPKIVRSVKFFKNEPLVVSGNVRKCNEKFLRAKSADDLTLSTLNPFNNFKDVFDLFILMIWFLLEV